VATFRQGTVWQPIQGSDANLSSALRKQRNSLTCIKTIEVTVADVQGKHISNQSAIEVNGICVNHTKLVTNSRKEYLAAILHLEVIYL
jgi:hypothetical protein